MAKDTKISKPSILAAFPISFEYDVSWKEAKKAVRVRTHKS